MQYQMIYNNLKKQVREFYEKLNLTTNMTTEQRYAEATKFDRFNSLQEFISNKLSSLNSNVINTINGKLGNVYQENYDYIANLSNGIVKPINLNKSKKNSKDTISPFQLIAVDTLKDKNQIKTNIGNQLLTAIVQGESLTGFYLATKNIIEKNLNSSTTIATNAFTRAENMARNVVAKKINKKYPVKKQWVAILDNRTRDAHRAANGQIVDIDKPFIVGGEELMYPGDARGSLSNIINCRCTTKIIFDKDK